LKPDLGAVVGLDRFLSEIQVTANLQHPNLLPLFDSGTAGDLLFYVMPFVEGESLRAKLEREKQLPIDEAVRIATTIAEALDYAHAQGVIHRDLKPENILVHAGQPVIADFGIALALSNAGGNRITQTGISLGTPQYMSPEQAMGDRYIDRRTDIYSLGAITYEMLTGEAPHTGATAQAVIARVLTEKPRSARVTRPNVPVHVDAAVLRALEKLAPDRFATARAFGEGLTGARATVPAAPGSARSPVTAGVVLLTGAVVAVALIAIFLTPRIRRPENSTNVHARTALSFQIPEGQQLALGNPSTLELSPDGTRLAYIADQGPGRRIYVRELANFDVRPIAGTDGASSLFFAPDGAHIGFYADGALRRVATAGGIATRIVDVPSSPVGASWGDDGTILYALGDSSGLWRVSADGGAPTRIPLILDTAWARNTPELPSPTNVRVLWPYHLPRKGLALVVPGFGTSIGVIELNTGRFRPLVAGNRAYYIPSGHIVFYSGPEQVSVVPFDLDRLEITGPVVPVVDDVLRPAGSEGRFTVSRNGTLAYARGGFRRRIELVDRFGRGTAIAVEPRGYRFPAVSPDGRLLAVTVDPQPPETWLIDLQSGRAQPVSTGGYHITPVWRRDGKRLAFFTNPGIAWIPWPEGGTPRAIGVNGSGGLGVTDWPVADKMLGTLRGDVFLLDVATGALTTWLESSAVEDQPRASPDGEWVAYESEVSGVTEIYVRRYSGAPPEILVSNGGGTEPVWSSSGSEIFYRNGNTIFSVPVKTRPRFEVLGAPKMLFSGDYDFSNPRNWDVMPDGRLVMIRSSPGVRREIRILSGWLK
jgi:serine/threonine-protein kinase